jgi:hypothetical protein
MKWWLSKMRETRADMVAEHNKELEALIGHSASAPDRHAMQDEMNIIQHQLGFEFGNEPQNWLRLHQILRDHEERLKHLESQVGTRKGGGDEIV